MNSCTTSVKIILHDSFVNLNYMKKKKNDMHKRD